MAKKKEVFRIKTGIYPFDIIVLIWGGKRSKVAKWVNNKTGLKKYDKYDGADFKKLVRYCPSDKWQPVLWLPHRPKTMENVVTVAHEVLHAVIAAHKWFGVSLSGSSEEAYTYLQSHLMKQLLRKTKFKKRLK